MFSMPTSLLFFFKFAMVEITNNPKECKPMPGEKRKKIIFIINPISGARRHKNISYLIDKYLDSDKFHHEIKYTQYAGHAVHLSREAVDSGIDIIVAVGGDGSINEVASQMIGSRSALGIIPLGSGNGLARHLGIPRFVPWAIKLINQSRIIKIDTATVNGRPFISIAGLGFDAFVAKRFANDNRRGFLTYAHIITNNYLSYKPKKYTLTFEDGKTLKTRSLFISFANSNQFGFNTAIAPDARLRDGKLDVCIVQKPKIFDLPIVANLLLLRAIDKSQYVKTIRSTHFTIKQRKNRVVNIDGEAIKISRKLTVQVLPLSLKIIIPQHEIK